MHNPLADLKGLRTPSVFWRGNLIGSRLVDRTARQMGRPLHAGEV